MTTTVDELLALASELNVALEDVDRRFISIDEVQHAIERGTIFHLLEARLGMPLSALGDGPRAQVLSEWQSMASPFDAREALSVRRGGLNLLLAYILQGVRNRIRARSDP